MPDSRSIEFTVKRSFFGSPVIYVRRGVPDIAPGIWKWGRWRKANLSEQNAAVIRLVGLNK